MSIYAKFIFATLFPLLITGNGFAASPVESEQREACHDLVARALREQSADSLLGSTPSDTDPTLNVLSEQARTFLSLVDVGLAHIPEQREFLNGLRRLPHSAVSLNPFLNLQSSIARALAARLEQNLVLSETDWELIRQRVSQRLGAASSVEIQQNSDRKTTSTLLKQFAISDGIFMSSETKYVGQTDRYYIFNETSHPEYQGLYVISKQGGKVRKVQGLQARLVGNFEADHRWMHNGFVYGFGWPDPGPTAGHLMIFQLNPDTLAFKWNSPWSDSPRVNYNFFWVRSSNLVVCVPVATSGSILALDYEQLRFVPTGLEFDLTEFSKPGDGPLNLTHGPDNGGPGLQVTIARSYKTDGRLLVQAGDSDSWRNWSDPYDWVDSAYGASEGYPELQIYERQMTYSHRYTDPRSGVVDWGWSQRTGRDPIKVILPFDFRSGTPSIQFVTVDEGASLLAKIFWHQKLTDQKDLWLLLLIDRKSWTAREVSLKGGPSINQSGLWQIIRNQASDVLLQFDSSELHQKEAHRVVALWQLNSSSGIFELKLHKTFDGNPELEETSRSIGPIVDYDTKSLVGWRHEYYMSLLIELEESKTGEAR